MEIMNKVYAAIFTSQNREFDECGHGYLPLFHSVFGIYENLWDAISEVSRFLYSEHKEYEVIEDCRSSDENGNTIGYNFTFRYKDKNTGAFGLYEIEISTEYITPKNPAHDTL